MKKRMFLIFVIIVSCLGIMFTANKHRGVSYKDKLIRFHVIANSDRDTDQKTKLKVRDAVLKEIGPKLEKSKSREESLRIIEKNKNNIEDIANKVLSKSGKKYYAKAVIGKFEFPIKTYGSITLPAGEYTALRLVLGKGEGKNWWCVMFPPLCFTDITRGITADDTDKKLREVMDDDEVKAVTTLSSSHSDNQPNIVLRCKSVEVFNDTISKIKKSFRYVLKK